MKRKNIIVRSGFLSSQSFLFEKRTRKEMKRRRTRKNTPGNIFIDKKETTFQPEKH